ncbi:exodeoxyribonuclease VII small subunit [Haliovirga abyssi]|uniref:Exodeoxyribonuclease 7 small subunit n=1 Tax=Haliovirga abyssi TaxID=2996794 RepID=A0AAU9DD63_9FUSO|nr:exodeoxyribonuclease VII small subunit [Haliovirga abyssi]BDU50252.1 hypothetical protein HLVA_08210 [Haliovirga abyssi]
MKKNLKFEEALLEIDEIIDELENGEVELEESVKKYEKAMEMIKFCKGKLDSIEGKIKKINLNESGDIEIADFQ